MIIQPVIVGGSGEPTLPAKDTLENMSWSDIAIVSASYRAPNFWQIGDTKNITIGGVTYPVEILGFTHDDLADGSGKAGITFGLKNSLNTTYSMNSSNTNAGGWESCALRTTLQSTIFNQLPPDLQSVIKPVIKQYRLGSNQTTISECTDTLFLFSVNEVTGGTSYSTIGEGHQYSRFATASDRIKTVNGTARQWWTRSTVAALYFSIVLADGSTNYDAATGSHGVAFGFCV